MDKHNFKAYLEEAILPGSGKAFYVPSLGGYLLYWGPTVPTDETAGYPPSCLFLHVDGSGEDTLYVNAGTVTSCNFDSHEIGLQAVLAAITNGNGASMIGVEDSAANYAGEDVEAVLAEIMTLVLKLTGGTLSGALSSTVGAAAAAVALRLGASATEGMEVKVIDETVELTNAVETDLTETVPAGAVILCAQVNLEALITGDGSGDDGLVKVGLGITADPDKYGKTADLTKNAKIDTIPDWTVLAAEETVTIKGCDAAGAAVTEKFTGGTGQDVRVWVVYAVTNSLDDAT